MDETSHLARPDLSRLGFRRFALLFAGLFALAALPVLFCDTLPLFDYPNHLARMHILADLSRAPSLQQFYAVVWQPVPNLAMDLIVPPLARIMPLAWAGKAFVLLTLFALAAGTAALNRVISGAWSAVPCLAFLLLYSRILLWGFLNYLFGIGLGLVALALWIALRGRHPAVRLALGTLFALMLFFCHLLAFGLYGALVMGYEAGRVIRLRPTPRRALIDLSMAGAAFLPALGMLFLASPGAVAGAIAFGRFVRKADLLFSVFDNYNRPFDVVCFALVAVALILAFWRRWMRLEASLVAPLIVLVLIYLAMPSQLATASGADHRIPLLLGLVLMAGSRWTAPRLLTQRFFLGGALLLFLTRLGVVMASWQASDRAYASLLPAFDQVPIGGSLAVAYPAEAINSEAMPMAHFPTLAILRRDAFVPTLFAYPTQQPVRLLPRYRDLADRLPPERLWAACATGAAPLDESERRALEDYDFVAFLARRPFVLPASAAFEPVFSAPRFQLVRVRRGAACAGSSAG